jgi:hypothetical protein
MAWWANLQLLGVIGAASYAMARLMVHSRALSWHRAFVVAVPRSGMPKMPRGFTVRSVSADELAQLEVDVTVEQQAERFAQGIDCLGAFNADGILTGVVWMSAGPLSEGDVALVLRPPADAAWDTGMWIHPDHRMGRTFQALWAGVAHWLAERGRDWSFSAIADYNLGSMGAHKRLGMVQAGKIVALRIRSWQWIAVGDARWRFVRPPERVTWDIAAIAAPPSHAA